MRVELMEVYGTWRGVADSANTTINREPGSREPSKEWKRKILKAEHSPIRQLAYRIKLYDLPYWVSVHLVRHKIGIEHWVRTQRSDRTGENRDELPQGAFVEHEILVNAQAMITISRKRMCTCASPETRIAWRYVLNCIKEVNPELFEACVPECVYRGFCPEFKPCGYEVENHRLEEYRR